MVDISKLYSDLQTTYAGSGVKVEMVRVGAGDSINIGEVLRNNRAGTPAATNPENGQKEIVAKEKATYKGSEGMLVRYADGTVEFQISKQKGDSKIQTVLQFKNEKDFQNEKPEKSVTGRVETDAQGNKKFVKTTETSFQYHFNGKIAHQETKNAKGTVLNTIDYDRKGKPQKKLVYDKEGNLQTTYKYKHKGEDTQLIEKYDKDNKLVLNMTVKLNGDKRVSVESRYPNGNMAGEATYDEYGKLKTQKDYFENGQLKADTVYHFNGVIKTQTLYDEQGKVTKTITDEIDGKFNESLKNFRVIVI